MITSFHWVQFPFNLLTCFFYVKIRNLEHFFNRKQDKLVCVECFKPINANNRCQKCNFPFCDDHRDLKNKFHENLECPILTSRGFKAAGDNNKKVKVAWLNFKMFRQVLKPSFQRLLSQISSLTPFRFVLKNIQRNEHQKFCSGKKIKLKLINKPLNLLIKINLFIINNYLLYNIYVWWFIYCTYN